LIFDERILVVNGALLIIEILKTQSTYMSNQKLNLSKRLYSIMPPSYAVLPLTIAISILFVVPLVFYVEVGRFLVFSGSADAWVQFATYFGGIAGPPLALIASWLVVVTVRESLNMTADQMLIQEKQLSLQKEERTVTMSLDVHRNTLNQIEKSLDIAAFVNEIEMEALKRFWVHNKPPWTLDYENVIVKQLRYEYIQMRSLYEAQINLYMSSVCLCMEMLFKLDTGETVSKISMQSSSKPISPIPINIYLAMLSEEEIRLLFLEAAFHMDSTLAAILSWAKVRAPIINGWMINDMSDDTQALHDAYEVIDREIGLMRINYYR
jgi:hypothetical protein